MLRGTVKFYNAGEGWGAVKSPDLPGEGEAFVHYSMIEGEGTRFRFLEPGQSVEFDYEALDYLQDGFPMRVTTLRKL
ncbi:cold-shock protein [Amycolatopsis sp. H20-H5]|uniref:cold-shock protein n=1 Tax=Amycolatopsis sp. H20-H5 TaxID=3046309 RepID=UPI002DBA3D09|nr:cold shock domain-containing protein [Amycolatopsis sp. H20-H5]MEC3975159.1 cold shock domain-containing protein [Amycolatopsis sp. H20-H5]